MDKGFTVIGLRLKNSERLQIVYKREDIYRAISQNT